VTLKDQSDSAPPVPPSDGGVAPAPNPTSDVSAPTIAFDSSTAAIEGETSSLNEISTERLQTLIGITLDNRYFIEKELGRGGVGAVYLARDRKLHDKAVVIKVLLEKSLQNSWVVQKFQQEKEALARVDHPGVVGVLDTGELPDGKPYLVMQFIDGVTLRSEIKSEGIQLNRAAELIKQTGRAMSAAHDKGVLHRDLKPENIMLQRLGGGEEQVKIIDFGIAKLKDSIVAPSTATGATAGTVSYMAPEQLSGRGVSAATDIYALGAIAYEMVTGRKPFNPETGFELLEMQRGGVRVDPCDLRPSLSEEASRIILRALSFDPKKRFQSAREFADALSRALAQETTLDQGIVERPQIPATQLSTAATPPAKQTSDLSSKTIAARYEPAPVHTLDGSVYPAALEDDSPTGRPWLKGGVALILIAAIVGGASVLIWKRNGLFGKKDVAASLPVRSLNYSLTVQKMRDGKPYQDTFETSGQEIFENGWKFRLNLSSPQEGYLYLLNEGPAAGDAVTYNVLFPEARTNAGSPRVSAEQKLQTAWMRFDEHQGTEKFWLVWSASPVKELDAVTDSVNEKDQSEIKDSSQERAVRNFLDKHSSPKPEVAKDSAKMQTTVKGRGDVLINFIELAHH
jgi:serine/threonine protein kinase